MKAFMSQQAHVSKRKDVLYIKTIIESSRASGRLEQLDENFYLS